MQKVSRISFGNFEANVKTVGLSHLGPGKSVEKGLASRRKICWPKIPSLQNTKITRKNIRICDKVVLKMSAEQKNSTEKIAEATSELKLDDPKSGFHFKYVVQLAPGKGKAVFTLEPIHARAKVWSPTHVKFYDENEFKARLEGLSETEIRRLLNHVYGKGERLIECLDDGEYVNHSKTNNTICSGMHLNPPIDDDNQCCYAVRDIRVGEELVDNYSAYDNPQWYLDLCKKYNVESARDVVEKYD